MQLKRYQERVVREVEAYLAALAREQASGHRKHAALDAWETVFGRSRPFVERRNGLGEDLPGICIKVPTGGGKTLLATQILGSIHRTVLSDRRGTGLVLWVVPSNQIYRDTLKALRDRRHFYRESLEFAVARPVEVWEKHEIHRLTPGQLTSKLNVMVVQLASANRETREQLKFFRDSGGNIVLHFPPEDDLEAHARLKERVSNLGMIGDALVASSLANLVRLCRPAVILDEGHKATSPLARKTIEEMNASIVVELSATPPEGANVLVSVSGRELLEEEMIKLPINVANSQEQSWRECLARACDHRKALAEAAARYYGESGKVIRPIVLVQVERTGKDERDGRYVHSDDVREHLNQKLGVPAAAIAVKSASADDIEGVDLLADGCPVEWIITKAALQEGWDCPFAYVLVSLNAGRSRVAMTQLVGRVLRQPYAERTDIQALDECYVYCLRRSASEVVREVKLALEKEGYEGSLAGVVDRTGEPGAPVAQAPARIRKKFLRHYGRPFKGRIFLPKFCVREGGTVELLDYFRHLLSGVDVSAFDFQRVAEWDLDALRARTGTSFFQVTLGKGPRHVGQEAIEDREPDRRVQDWLAVNLPFEEFSLKELRLVVERATARILAERPGLVGRLGVVKHVLREKLSGFIREEADRQTERAFRELHECDKLLFYLQCVRGQFEIPQEIERRAVSRLNRKDGSPIQRCLFEPVDDDLNDYERDVALFLDQRPEVLWWYRNLVGPENFSIQGYRRDRIYPDFVVQEGTPAGRPKARVLVVESKGAHLAGNADTTYKKAVASVFNEVGKKVTWQELGAGFADHRFRFQVLDQGEYAGGAWENTLAAWLALSA